MQAPNREQSHNGAMKFTAKRIPDFARLHALEDARVARWKRTHKREITVPLGVRIPCLAHSPGSMLMTVIILLLASFVPFIQMISVGNCC